MKCPHCNKVLSMAERKGIEIDYCPSCRGVWLDRGELDKIIALSIDSEWNLLALRSQLLIIKHLPIQAFHLKN